MTENGKMEKDSVSIAINNQYIKDLSLEIPLAPEIFKEVNTSPKLDIKIDVDAKHLEGNIFNVSLKLNMDADAEDKKFFILELVYASVVSLNVPEEHIEPVLLIEIPRLLFPYVRSTVTNTLTNAGLPPLMLNPVDFAALYQAKKEPKN